MLCDKCGNLREYHPTIDGQLYCLMPPPRVPVDTSALVFEISYTDADGRDTTFNLGYDTYKLGQRIERIVRDGATALSVVLKFS